MFITFNLIWRAVSQSGSVGRVTCPEQKPKLMRFILSEKKTSHRMMFIILLLCNDSKPYRIVYLISERMSNDKYIKYHRI